MQNSRRRAGESLGHRLIPIVHYSRIAEHPPGQRDRGRFGQGRQQSRDCPVADMDVDEFVNIQRQKPVRAGHQRMLVRKLQCRPLRPLAMRSGIADMGQPAQCLQPVQHGIGAVVAIVGKDKKICDPAGPVMCQPLQQERAFIADAKDGRDLHCRPHSSSSNIPAGGIRPLHPHLTLKA